MLCYVIVEYIQENFFLLSIFFYFEFLFNSLLSERKERKRNEEIEKMMMARPDGAIGCGGVK